MYTWKAPGDNARFQIDFIMIKERFRNSIKNVCTHPGADIDSDHNLLVAKMKVELKKIKSSHRNEKWNLHSLKNDSANHFGQICNERFENNIHQIENGQGPNDRWIKLKKIMFDVAMETFGKTKGKRIKKPWVTDEMVKRMEERRTWKRVNSEEGRRKYRELNNKLRRETDLARKKWLKEECTEIENLTNMGKYDFAYEKVRSNTWISRG